MQRLRLFRDQRPADGVPALWEGTVQVGIGSPRIGGDAARNPPHDPRERGESDPNTHLLDLTACIPERMEETEHELSSAELKWNMMLVVLFFGPIHSVGLYIGEVHWYTPTIATVLFCVILGWGDLREIGSRVVGA